ncbi:unnamed protein product, partial [Polarella glacialis]
PSMWLVADPCGKNFAIATHILLLSTDLVVSGCVLWPWLGAAAWPWIGAFQVSYVLAAWAHLACMLTDPGAVPLGDGEDEALPVEAEVDAPPVRRCRHCRIVKPARAHHCSTCCRCISKMDHHCMWTNNCVGMHNQKHFLLFLVYTCLHCSAAGLAVLIYFAVNGVSLGPAAVPLLACYFARLTASLLREQLGALRRNQTGIELLQGSCGEPRELAETLREVMGGPPGWRWLLPVPVRRGNQQSKRAADESHDC